MKLMQFAIQLRSGRSFSQRNSPAVCHDCVPINELTTVNHLKVNQCQPQQLTTHPDSWWAESVDNHHSIHDWLQTDQFPHKVAGPKSLFPTRQLRTTTKTSNPVIKSKQKKKKNSRHDLHTTSEAVLNSRRLIDSIAIHFIGRFSLSPKQW